VTDPAYGAKCDGSTDDTAAVQAALTAANNAHGGFVYVPMGTHGACVIAGQLIMDNYLNVSLAGGSFGRPNGPNPRSWLQFTGTTSPLISCKSCFGVHIKNLYLQYTGAFTGVFIELGHSGLGWDSSGNYIGFNFLGKTGSGGAAAALISLDQANSNIVEGNQLADAAAGVRGRNGPSGNSGMDYSNANTIRNNIMGNSGSASFTGASIENMGTGTVIENNTFEVGSSGAPTLRYTGQMSSSGSFTGNWDGDMSGSATFAKYDLVAGCKWDFAGNFLTAVSANVTGFKLGNNCSASVHGNTFAEGSTFGTMFSVGTGVNLDVAANSYGAVTTFLSGIPASGRVVDNSGKTMIFGALAVPTSLQVGSGTVFTGSQGAGTLVLSNTATPPLMFGCTGAAKPAGTFFLSGGSSCNLGSGYSFPVSAGSFANLRCAANAGGVNNHDGVITIRRNSVVQPVTCTLGTGTSCNDTIHSFNTTAGDKVDVQVATQASTTLNQITCTVEKQ
jgi:hypothetical protein